MLEVSLGGSMVEKRAASFRLMTQAGFHSAIARLVYPSDNSVSEGTAVGTIDDEISVSLTSGEKTDLYFTGKVYSVNTHGAHRELLLTDSYKKLCDTEFTCAYRKEKVSSILDDILGATGVTDKSITCPDVELARFSTQTITARYCIDLLIDALTEHGEKGLAYFFDEKDTFHFGKMGNTGKNEGDAFSFETSKNILRSGSGWIEVLPCPVRHTQAITIDGKAMVTVRTDLTVSRSLSRLMLWVKGV
jgi:hypothetical protein